MEKEALPRYSAVDEFPRRRRRKHGPPRIVKILILTAIGYIFYKHWHRPQTERRLPGSPILSVHRLHADYAICSKLQSVPHDPSGPRERSARYVDGHGAVLIRNATVWTGEPAAGTTADEARIGKGYSWIRADVLLESGLIKCVQQGIKESQLPEGCTIYEAQGRQLTTGIVDMHSHTGVESLPQLVGSSDGNELSGDITPFVRSIDGLNPLDRQIQTIKSGGVTTSLILPGSGNNMGGEAYVIKNAVGKPDGRTEISTEDMLADPEKNWRYMKMACGENPKSVYGRVGRDFGPFSRLGEAWEFRHAFEQASALVKSQDDWCSAAASAGAENMQSYLPQELKWESLGALLRGQVLLNTHCYTPLDMEAFIRHTSEFNFTVRAFHHAHGSYVIPEVLKRAYGGRPPAVALFADFMYYKAESYVASEQAGKILWENGITPVYVSDNPVINAQHLVFEAAKAYRNGLPYHVALAGVTSASAELLGLGERVGKVKPGFDADIVVWDSDPLSVGAAPVQVWIDGAPQFENPVELQKPLKGPIEPMKQLQDIKESSVIVEDIIFRNVSGFLIPGMGGSLASGTNANVVVRHGSIICAGACDEEVAAAQQQSGLPILTLNEGYLAPTLTAIGTSLGLVEIEGEEVAQDGANSDESFSRALDGLTLGGKNLRAAYSHGVTKSISAPTYQDGLFKGLSVGFSTGANNSLEKGAVWQDEIALHYSLAKSSKTPSLSSGIGELRRRLEAALRSNATDTDTLETKSVRSVVAGKQPLVISVQSADLIAAVLRLKADIEAIPNASTLRIVILGGAESHMLADEIAHAKVGVVLAPMLAFGETWDQRRALIGAPTTNGTAIDALHAAGVKIALGTSWNYQARDLYLAAGIAYTNGGGKISEKDALAMVSSNVHDMLGLDAKNEPGMSFAVFEGHPLEINGRVRAVADGRGMVEAWL